MKDSRMSKIKYEVVITTRTVPIPPERVPAWRESVRIFLDLADQFYQKHPEILVDEGIAGEVELGGVQTLDSGKSGNLEPLPASPK
jgi:hypothetical protein